MLMAKSKDEGKESRPGGSDYFRILSIDGGGIRGIVPAAVLIEVESQLRTLLGDETLKIGECFDMVAGTSTGGILACLFLAPSPSDPARARFGAADALSFYLENGDEIFERSAWQKFRSAGGVVDEKYSADTLETLLKKYLGDLKLSELIRPSLITAYDTKLYRPTFFTQHDAVLTPLREYLVRDVGRATSAAPTYFQTALAENMDEIPNAHPMIDGGVFANNPAACALVEALALTKAPQLGRIAILSLGTGRKSATISYSDSKDWGLVQWARPLIGILMEGVSQTVDYQLKTIYGSLGKSAQYLRIDGEFGDRINDLDIEGLDPAMDNADPQNMKRLERFGRQLAQNKRAEIEAFVKTIMVPAQAARAAGDALA
jgi:patatin-like phospholipase/acyl hydrolase